jgi:uncharacterized membrane protein HdeD (DUF308 family)
MTDHTQVPQPHAPRSLGSQLVPLRKNWGWLVAAGIMLIILGSIGLVATFTFGLISTYSFGVMMLAGGGFLMADAFRHDGWRGRIWSGLIGILYVVTGLMVFHNPVSALITLTLFAAIVMIVAGVVRIVMAFQIRPMAAWVMVLISGVLSLLLGGFILAQWPNSSRWVLGTFLSIELIFQGWASLALARAIRSTFDGVKPRAV